MTDFAEHDFGAPDADPDRWANSSLGGGVVEDLPDADPDRWANSSLGGGVVEDLPDADPDRWAYSSLGGAVANQSDAGAEEIAGQPRTGEQQTVQDIDPGPAIAGDELVLDGEGRTVAEEAAKGEGEVSAGDGQVSGDTDAADPTLGEQVDDMEDVSLQDALLISDTLQRARMSIVSNWR